MSETSDLFRRNVPVHFKQNLDTCVHTLCCDCYFGVTQIMFTIFVHGHGFFESLCRLEWAGIL